MIVTSTLSPGSLDGLARAVRALGLQFQERPLLRFTAPRTWRPLDEALTGIQRYRVLALSSPRAATVVRARMTSRRLYGNTPRPEVWAAGPSTRAAFGDEWPAHVPQTASGAAALADALLRADVAGPILYPCASQRRDEFPDRLRAAGREVREVTCYEVCIAAAAEIVEALAGSDLVIVASHRVLAAAEAALRGGARPGLVCLGPATGRTAHEMGWEPGGIAGEPTVAAVAAAVRGCLVPDARQEVRSEKRQGAHLPTNFSLLTSHFSLLTPYCRARISSVGIGKVV